MRRYQEELGIPFVYVTHNQEEALTMSDRMTVMHRGGLEQVGPKLEVYNAPATRFVAFFVGAPNKLTGRAMDSAGECLHIDWNGVTLIGRVGSGARRGDAVAMYIKSERIAIGIVLVFTPTFAASVTPRFLGGPNGAMFGNRLEHQFGATGTWALGSAMGVVMFAASLSVIALVWRTIRLLRADFTGAGA